LGKYIKPQMFQILKAKLPHIRPVNAAGGKVKKIEECFFGTCYERGLVAIGGFLISPKCLFLQVPVANSAKGGVKELRAPGSYAYCLRYVFRNKPVL